MEIYVLLGIEPVPNVYKGEIFYVLSVGRLTICQEKMAHIRQNGSYPMKLLKVPTGKKPLDVKLDALFRAPYDTSQTGRWNLDNIANWLQNPIYLNPPYQLIDSYFSE